MSSGSDFAHRASFPYLSGLHVGNRCVGEDMLTLHNTILSQKNHLSSNYFPGFMQRMCRRRNCRCQTSDYVVIWQSAGGKCRRREEKQKQDERSERCGRKNAHARGRKGGKVAKDCVCPISGCSGEAKSRLAKAAGIEPCGEMRGENVRSVVVRSRRIQEGTNTSRPEQFWEFIG
jgi:hypothetical protein